MILKIAIFIGMWILISLIIAIIYGRFSKYGSYPKCPICDEEMLPTNCRKTLYCDICGISWTDGTWSKVSEIKPKFPGKNHEISKN